jgi:hypothetical protein
MKNTILILLLTVTLKGFGQGNSSNATTYHIERVQNGADGNGWIFDNVNYTATFRYEKNTSYNSHSLFCDFNMTLDVVGYRYNGKIYTLKELNRASVQLYNYTATIEFSTGRKSIGGYYKPNKDYSKYLDTYDGEKPDLSSLSIKNITYTSLTNSSVEANLAQN